MKTCADCRFWTPNQSEVEQAEYGLYECANPTLSGLKTKGTFGCNEHVGADATEVNVPQHTKKGTMTDPNPNPVDGPTEIVIVTYRKDFPWLSYCLHCIDVMCNGFSGITVVIPHRDLEELHKTAGVICNIPIRIRTFDEIPGKGMLHHMIMLARADELVPPGTKYVLTCDADCMFRMPTTPEHYFWNDKPYCIVRSWASLTTEDPRNPGSKVISDCAQWKPATDRQLGFDTAIFGMCMNTIVFPIDFFANYRAHIERVHNRTYDEFMLDGRNEFPQSNMDFTAMVAYAHRFMPERFTWFDVEKPPYPVDRKQAFWSHGGITPEIVAQIESYLK